MSTETGLSISCRTLTILARDFEDLTILTLCKAADALSDADVGNTESYASLMSTGSVEGEINDDSAETWENCARELQHLAEALCVNIDCKKVFGEALKGSGGRYINAIEEIAQATDDDDMGQAVKMIANAINYLPLIVCLRDYLGGFFLSSEFIRFRNPEKFSRTV